LALAVRRTSPFALSGPAVVKELPVNYVRSAGRLTVELMTW
jgi:hypothetical protein